MRDSQTEFVYQRYNQTWYLKNSPLSVRFPSFSNARRLIDFQFEIDLISVSPGRNGFSVAGDLVFCEFPVFFEQVQSVFAFLSDPHASTTHPCNDWSGSTFWPSRFLWKHSTAWSRSKRSAVFSGAWCSALTINELNYGLQKDRPPQLVIVNWWENLILNFYIFFII